MQIETKVTLNDDEEEVKQYYTVKSVSQWADDEQFQYETKKYKKMKIEQNMQKRATLFDDVFFE